MRARGVFLGCSPNRRLPNDLRPAPRASRTLPRPPRRGVTDSCARGSRFPAPGYSTRAQVWLEHRSPPATQPASSSVSPSSSILPI